MPSVWFYEAAAARSNKRAIAILLLVLAAAVAPAGRGAPDSGKLRRDAFGEVGARHDDAVRYRLPFPTEIPRFLGQGVGGHWSHTDAENYHAFDFGLPIGTPVLAARAGVVAQVVDEFESGSLDRTRASENNSVALLHDDGTFARYGHLRRGIPVKVGARVERGGLVAFSGYTGYGSAPHLHFSVSRRLASGGSETLPIRFGKGAGFVPEQGQYYGSPRKPSVAMRAKVRDKPVTGEDISSIPKGGSLQLTVELRMKNLWVDVTEHERVRFASVTPWALRIDDSGVVTGAPVAGFENMQAPRQFGSAMVFFGKPQEKFYGHAQIWFEIEGAEPAERDGPRGRK